MKLESNIMSMEALQGSIGVESAVLQRRCMSKVLSREIWVSDSRTISDGERTYFTEVLCAL